MSNTNKCIHELDPVAAEPNQQVAVDRSDYVDARRVSLIEIAKMRQLMVDDLTALRAYQSPRDGQQLGVVSESAIFQYDKDNLQQEDGVDIIAPDSGIGRWVRISDWTGSQDFENHINDTNNPHQVTPEQIGAATETALQNHINDTNNPHQVTPKQIGAATETDLQNHINDTNNPHQVTPEQIGAIPTTEKGSPNGVVPLNDIGKIDSGFLPSYVDDVLEYDSLSDFPATGETGKIYIAKDTNKTYRWTGSDYVEISPQQVITINDGNFVKYSPNSGYTFSTDDSAIQTALDGKSDIEHTHDDRYYTESEIDTKLSEKADKVSGATAGDIATLTADGNIQDGGIDVPTLQKQIIRIFDENYPLYSQVSGIKIDCGGTYVQTNFTYTEKSTRISKLFFLLNGDYKENITNISIKDAQGNILYSGLPEMNYYYNYPDLPDYSGVTEAIFPNDIILEENGQYEIRIDFSTNTAYSLFSVSYPATTYNNDLDDGSGCASPQNDSSIIFAFYSEQKEYYVRITEENKIEAKSINGQIDDIIQKINTKADKVSGVVSGHLAQLDSTGNLVDSTVKTEQLEDIILLHYPDNTTNWVEVAKIEYETNDIWRSGRSKFIIEVFDDGGNNYANRQLLVLDINTACVPYVIESIGENIISEVRTKKNSDGSIVTLEFRTAEQYDSIYLIIKRIRIYTKNLDWTWQVATTPTLDDSLVYDTYIVSNAWNQYIAKAYNSTISKTWQKILTLVPKNDNGYKTYSALLACFSATYYNTAFVLNLSIRFNDTNTMDVGDSNITIIALDTQRVVYNPDEIILTNNNGIYELWASAKAGQRSELAVAKIADNWSFNGGIVLYNRKITLEDNYTGTQVLSAKYANYIDRYEEGTALPSSPPQGKIYYKTDTDELYIYTSAGWKKITIS